MNYNINSSDTNTNNEKNKNKLLKLFGEMRNSLYICIVEMILNITKTIIKIKFSTVNIITYDEFKKATYVIMIIENQTTIISIMVFLNKRYSNNKKTVTVIIVFSGKTELAKELIRMYYIINGY